MNKTFKLKKIFSMIGIFLISIRIFYKLTASINEIFDGGDTLYHLLVETILLSDILTSLLLSVMASIIFFYIYEYSKYLESGYDSLLDLKSFLELRIDSLISLIDPLFMADNISNYDFNYSEIMNSFIDKINQTDMTEEFYNAYIKSCVRDLKKHEIYNVGLHPFYWIKQNYNIIMTITRSYALRFEEYDNNIKNLDFEELYDNLEKFDELAQKSILYFYENPEKRMFNKDKVRKALKDEIYYCCKLILSIDDVNKKPLKYIFDL